MVKIPRLIKWVVSIVLFFLAVLTLFRFLFYFHYGPAHYAFPGNAFVMGFRYDLRLVCILGLAMLLLCSIPFINPFKNKGARKFWNVLLPLLFFIMLFFYVTDYFHYDYLHQRLNASVLNYLEDAGISMNMVWQTYPVIKVLLLLVLLVIAIVFLFSKIIRRFQQAPPQRTRFAWAVVTTFVLLLAVGTWGTLSQFPLRWSNVYTLGDAFRAQLALNPFQSFFSTLKFKNSTYDLKKVKEDYALMSEYMGVQKTDSAQLNFIRAIPPGASPVTGQPNVVLVICESFSAYKSSMWGNPLNTSPYFNQLCKEGVFFDHCFTPSYGTARGVWATLTGTPDVESPRTASRNPSIVDQHILINDFDGYDKFYFLGGDANWANIRGLLKNNIQGLKIYEQEDFKAGRVDVWGISDKNLFLEANNILAKQQKPFFAVIQTADNHRPYTIPEQDRQEFKLVELPKDTLNKYGFASNDELNAFRYTDFCYSKFMEAAKKSPYFKNTLFVFVGDHGIRGDAGTMFPKTWTELALTTVHVPLLFYGPAFLQPSRQSNICSQIDILPSVVGLLSRPLVNTTMGRNLFDSSLRKDPFRFSSAFNIDPDEKKIGFMTDQYYFRKTLTGKTTELGSMLNNDPIPPRVRDSVSARLGRMADAYYETAKYLLYTNKKK
jgi:phosphoglycerol transferase MdoB-like AlkP superfamily enzyme